MSKKFKFLLKGCRCQWVKPIMCAQRTQWNVLTISNLVILIVFPTISKLNYLFSPEYTAKPPLTATFLQQTALCKMTATFVQSHQVVHVFTPTMATGPAPQKWQEPLYHTPTSLNGHLSTMATFLCHQGNLIFRVSLPASKSKKRGRWRSWKRGCSPGACLAGVVERCNCTFQLLSTISNS